MKNRSVVGTLALFLLLGGGVIASQKLIQQNQDNRSSAEEAVVKKEYGELCGSNSDCKSGYCAKEKGISICAEKGKDTACTAMGGKCTVSLKMTNGDECKTLDNKLGVVKVGLCYKTINKRCCVPGNGNEVGAGAGSENCTKINPEARCVAPMASKNNDACKMVSYGSNITGRVVINKCSGEYSKTARCCIPNEVFVNYQFVTPNDRTGNYVGDTLENTNYIQISTYGIQLGSAEISYCYTSLLSPVDGGISGTNVAKVEFNKSDGQDCDRLKVIFDKTKTLPVNSLYKIYITVKAVAAGEKTLGLKDNPIFIDVNGRTIPAEVESSGTMFTISPNIIPTSTPTPVSSLKVMNCSGLYDLNRSNFESCAKDDFNSICFDKYTGVYAGCGWNSESGGCIVNNMYADRHIECPLNIGVTNSPSSSPKTCGELSSLDKKYFTKCDQMGFMEVCFNKYTGVFQGCADEGNYNNCLANDQNATNNVKCPIIVGNGEKVDGVCGSSLNTCVSGRILQPVAESNTQYLWYCFGSNGGKTASCTKDK